MRIYRLKIVFDSLVDNVFLYDIHIGPFLTKLIEKVPRLFYKEMTNIIVMEINVEDMASHPKIRANNLLHKRKT